MSHLHHLFLAANAHESLEHFTPLLTTSPHELRVAFVPTAADPYLIKNWMWEDVHALEKIGFRVEMLDIKNHSQAELHASVQKSDIIFVGGGNTFYLLEQFRLTGFDAIIKHHVDQGKWYIGSSAGSVVVGPDIEPIRCLDDPKAAPTLTTHTGLGLINTLILPHWGQELFRLQYQQFFHDYYDKPNLRVLPLRNHQAVIVTGDQLQLVGEE